MDRNRTDRRETYRDNDSDRGARDRRTNDRDSGRGRDGERGADRSRDRGADRDSDGRGRSRGVSYEYQARSVDDTKRRASAGANEYDKILKDSVKMWKPNDGDNRIRILPPTWPDARHFGYDIHVHYGVGPDRGTYLCLQKMLGKDDPIDEERQRARKDDDEKYAKELEAKRRVLVYLIDRDHPKEGIQAWAMPWTVDRDIVKVSVDKSSGEVLPIDHPEDGYDVEFEKKGAKDRTEYLGVAIARRSSPLGNDDWLQAAMDAPLPDQLKYYDYDHIAKAFGGGGVMRDKHADDRAPDRPTRHEDQPERGRSSARDLGPRGGDDVTFESVHQMTAIELEDLIDQERLDIDPREAKDDADLADWVCEEMKLKPSPRRERTRESARDDDSPGDRLRRMRESRGD
jgi:hypothetical protein